MKNLVTYILQSITGKPDDVHVEESTEQDGTIILTATVAQEDIGKVIGKEGKTIRAIRQLLRIRAIRDNVRVHFELSDQ